MSNKLMISMLKTGKNGNEILAILDGFTAQDESTECINQPTLETIEF